MLSIAVILALASSVYGAGELSIVHHPGSLVFRGHEAIKENALLEVFSAALGFSTEHFTHWQGFYIENPFSIPEAIINIAIDGVQDAGPNKGHHFPLLTNDDESAIFKSLAKRISERYPTETPSLIRVDLSNGLDDINQYEMFDGLTNEISNTLSYQYLKLDVDEDRTFLNDIALLHRVAETVETGTIKEDFVPDVYWFHISSLHALSDFHGANSSETQEAKQLLQEAINALTNAFVKRYNNRVLVSVITSDAIHTRQRRNILAATYADDTTSEDYNLASTYTKDYPAIFNIILWFCVAMFFSLLAICYVTANMDPGRDSIIYRMTSTRMKKDN